MYIYDFIDNQLYKLTDWDQRKQVVKLEYIDGVLYFEGIEYIEDIIRESRGFIGVLSI